MKPWSVFWCGALVMVCCVGLTACAATPPQPRVVVAPAPGKPPDLFEQEDEMCRSQAEESVDADAPTDAVVGSALAGALIGAVAGNAVSGRHHDRTGSGAFAGLIVGTAAGLNRGAATSANAQRQYDLVYQQCMAAKGNEVPGAVYRQLGPVLMPPPPSQKGAQSYAPPPPPPPAR